MVKVNNFAPQPNQAFNPTANSSPQASFNEPNQSQPASPKGLFQIPPAFLQWIPLIPFILEQATGQKIPPMGGTIGEIQSALGQVQFNLTQLLNQQQQLWTKLESLENNASQQLTSLSQQVASTNKSFHLLATETKRSLEFNSRPQAEPSLNAYPENEY